jgi:hypothetical protein
VTKNLEPANKRNRSLTRALDKNAALAPQSCSLLRASRVFLVNDALKPVVEKTDAQLSGEIEVFRISFSNAASYQ